MKTKQVLLTPLTVRTLASVILFSQGVFCMTASAANPASQGQGNQAGSHGTDEQSAQFDVRLAKMLVEHGVEPIDSPPQDSDQVVLGQALFFDRILSGNRDTACATCHHPLTATSDALALGVGTGTETPGQISFFRGRGEGRLFIPRNSPDVFNRGSVHWQTAFWDGRASTADGVIISPAGDQLPSGLSTPLQVQAMFPVTSRDEMRGDLHDVALGNELAAFEDDDFIGMWDAIMARLLAIEAYRDMFAAAFPGVPEDSLGFQHAAIAIAAFEAEAFGMNDSPFDDYLAGKRDALSIDAKRGAILFYGAANCASCHSGSLLTDQSHHNLAVPQLGPGKDLDAGLDFGRFGVTGDASDLFKFRTPALRNVTQTGPWMHNGAYGNLEDAILHHIHPEESLLAYDPFEQLAQEDLRPLVVNDSGLNEWMLDTSEMIDVKLNKNELGWIIAFLESLTAPELQERLLLVVPESVPSGMLEDGMPVAE
ncbi:MAG: cytochrome-c peroxidase [Rubripirellula sp.]